LVFNSFSCIASMSSPMRALVASAMLAVAHAQGVIIGAQGPDGPASPGLLVDPTKADANIINQQEIVQNVVNECGRTILGGNIDIGETTENQLGNNTVTKVTKGSNVDITIAQVSADGAGPYSCDLDLTSNANGANGQTKLQVKEAKPQNGNIKLSVTMPDDLVCVGGMFTLRIFCHRTWAQNTLTNTNSSPPLASTGDVCTIRCFNDNAKGPFGGCVAVQQTDTTPKQNTPDNIPTAQTLDGVLTQVQQNIVDLPAAVKSNQEAATQDEQGVTAIKEILGNNATTEAAGPAENGNGNNNNNNGGGNANNGGKKNNNNNNNANNGKGNGRNRGKGNANANNGAATGGNGGNARGGNNADAQTGGGGNGRGRQNQQNNNNNNNNNNNKREARDLLRPRRARRNVVPGV
ncbi:gegh16 protein, partial [Colletotrichum incanum]